MLLLFNILALMALSLFYGMFIYKTVRGALVMRGFELVRTAVLYGLTVYVMLSNIFPLPMFAFLNNYFWSIPCIWWAGIAVMYIGLVLYFIDIIQFASNFKIGVDENSENLTTTGFYAFSRNPMYISFIIFWLGVFLAFANLGTLLILIGFMLFLHLQVVFKEEPFLRKRYGAEYDNYCKRARRWL